MRKKTVGLGPQIFAYRWGTNNALWEGGSPSRKNALKYLQKTMRSGQAPESGWEVGPAGRTPAYGKILRAGDILLFYAGAKFEGQKGVYGIALAGTDLDEKAGRLAIHPGSHRLKFRLLSKPSKALAYSPFKGHDELFAPPGPSATLLLLKTVPQEVCSLVDKALSQVAQHPAVALPVRTSSQKMPIDRLLQKAIKQLAALPPSDRVRAKREITQAVRNALLRPLVCKLWGYACAACGLLLRDDAGNYECEVAHIREVRDDGKDLLCNTLPLCRTHHWAFDRNLWAIRPDTLVIKVRKGFRRHESLRELHGKELTRPVAPSDVKILEIEHLQRRWMHFTSQARGTHS